MEQHEAMRELTANSMLVNGAQFATDMAKFRQIEFGAKPTDAPQATISLDVTAQPLFHKNFDLLSHSLEDYILKGYKIYILADSSKQNERLKEILGSEERRTKIRMQPLIILTHPYHIPVRPAWAAFILPTSHRY